jgi:CRISPR-associated protein Csb1
MLHAGPLFKSATAEDIGWTLDEQQAAKEKKGGAVRLGKEGKPSEANHGNVTPSISETDRETGLPMAGGVTVASAEQMVVLSLPALRRLQFPLNGGKADPKVNEAGRTVLTALALCAGALALEKGFDLRSRCLLWPSVPQAWEILDKPGTAPTRVSLDAEAAIKLLNEAVAAAEKVGLKWRVDPLILKPSPQLMALVKRSQELAAQEATDAEGAD